MFTTGKSAHRGGLLLRKKASCGSCICSFCAITQVEVVDTLTTNQQAELILDPDSGALEDPTIVKAVFGKLSESPDNKNFRAFFQAFSDTTKQVSL